MNEYLNRVERVSRTLDNKCKPPLQMTISDILQSSRNHSAKNNSKIKVLVIQKTGEEEAISQTSDIERGNVLKDVQKTEGYSTEAVFQFGKYFGNLLEDLMKALAVKKSKTEYWDVYDDIMRCESMIHAEAVKAFRYGNCLDFSRVVYAHLLKEDTKEFIYLCELAKPYDHVFVITYNDEVSSIGDMTPDEAIVADAWFDGKKCSLQDYFIAGNNPLNPPVGLSSDKIIIKEKKCSQGNNVTETGLSIEEINGIILKHIEFVKSKILPVSCKSRLESANGGIDKNMWNF